MSPEPPRVPVTRPGAHGPMCWGCPHGDWHLWHQAYPLHSSIEAGGDGCSSSQLAEIRGSPNIEWLLQVQEGVRHLAMRGDGRRFIQVLQILYSKSDLVSGVLALPTQAFP